MFDLSMGALHYSNVRTTEVHGGIFVHQKHSRSLQRARRPVSVTFGLPARSGRLIGVVRRANAFAFVHQELLYTQTYGLGMTPSLII